MQKKILSIVLFLLVTIGYPFAQDLPTQTSTLFSGSGNCAVCHQPVEMNNNVLRDTQGNDISPVTLWKSTMMANAAKDPFWQAKMTAEILANPHLQSIIEDKCITCHSPLGRTEALYHGEEFYTYAEMLQDTLAMDGVSCTACHQIKSDNLGTPESYSGHFIIEDDRIIYGPYTNPLTRPMQNRVNYTPIFGEQTHQSDLCATCHNLFTPYVDNEGIVVGEAPEQTPHLEWKNSIYPEKNIECQSCHMPEIDDPVVISTMPASLAARTPFAKHIFVGGNVYMLRLQKKYRAELGITADAADFDSTIARTLRLLQNESADLTASYHWLSDDTLQVKLAIKNNTGHKFPTSYPSRRAWLYLGLRDENSKDLFESGKWDVDLDEIIGLDAEYEIHHDLINNPVQVQVYQSVMKDVDDKVNYTLLRAAGYIKDNRIPPEGFSKSGPGYDSTAIIGLAENDLNFNKNGVGTDTITYRIGGLNIDQVYSLNAKLYYQTLSPRFVKDLWQYDTPQVSKFKSYYQEIPNFPVTIDSLTLNILSPTSIGEQGRVVPDHPILVNAYPNPFNPIININIRLQHAGKLSFEIYNILGERVKSFANRKVTNTEHIFNWDARSDQGDVLPSGVYILLIQFNDSQLSQKFTETQKIIYLK